MINDRNPIKLIEDIIHQADGIVITAGAGMGVDSGIPDFRGNTGLWTAEKENFIKFADGNAWFTRPLETWNFYINRLINYSKNEPHRGYYELQKINTVLKKDTFVVTSNVDMHFERSGWNPNNLYEIHGNLKWIQCSKGCCADIQPMPDFKSTLNSIDEAPHCPKCNAVSRPHVMMFNDMWFIGDITAEQAKRYFIWERGRKKIVGIEIGAGTAVPSIRTFGQNNTDILIRINPHDYQIYRDQDISIPETAVKGIDIILDILKLK